MSITTDATFKSIKKLNKKLVKTQHRVSNCSTYIKNDAVPTGFKIKLTPNIGNISKRFLNRWNSILHSCSKQLMDLCLSWDLHQVGHIIEAITANDLKLRNAVSQGEYEELCHILEGYNSTLSKSLLEKQTKKISRDSIHLHSRSNNGRQRVPTVTPQRPTNKPSTKTKRNRRFKRITTDMPSELESHTNAILNLSSVVLSDSETSLLSKGLYFCPVPREIDEKQLREDTRAFFRRMRLKEHFSSRQKSTDFDNESDTESSSQSQEQTTSYEPDPFRVKSTWDLRPGKCPTLETYIEAVESDIEKLLQNPTQTYDNLTRDERSSIQALKTREDIVIKKADKGSTVVVMDKQDYIAEANRQLSNQFFYRKIDFDPTKSNADAIIDTLEKMRRDEEISLETFTCLVPSNDSTPGQFYLLPKIHKEGIPGRPIVSAIGYPTEKISQFLDMHLRPHVETIPSYLKDTTDYMNKTPTSNLPDNTLLVTMDVASLYTNIPHDEGIEACKEVWNSRKHQKPSTDSLVELLEHVLKRNNFMFNGEHYLQVSGTAMGTKMAPSYANIFMGRLEKQLLLQVPTKPLSWLRFIDDIEIKWVEGRESLDNCVSFVNSFHHSIKFTVDISDTTNTFLDTKSTLRNGEIEFDLHTKPTDAHLYLMPSSCHPHHIFKGLPKGLAIRARRICSSEESYERQGQQIKSHLCKRGYKPLSVTNAIDEVKTIDRSSLLQYREKTKCCRVPLVTTYHPASKDLNKILKDNFPKLLDNPRLAREFGEPPMVSFRRSRNIKDLVVRARLD
ncbi:uncharacterized protein LOC125647009 [Ostrea edulis]|uniref:uncharacterized protein LOC125647009 n=1 Tax=Ostrea edulis TaxID=37623 RepID=UPI0024AFAFAB|nr:uncharacterized protein LOC125647009 [Ostrea edulis]